MHRLRQVLCGLAIHRFYPDVILCKRGNWSWGRPINHRKRVNSRARTQIQPSWVLCSQSTNLLFFSFVFYGARRSLLRLSKPIVNPKRNLLNSASKTEQTMEDKGTCGRIVPGLYHPGFLVSISASLATRCLPLFLSKSPPEPECYIFTTTVYRHWFPCDFSSELISQDGHYVRSGVMCAIFGLCF